MNIEVNHLFKEEKMSNSLQVYTDGGGGFCLESVDIALEDYYKSDEVTIRGFHPFYSSKISGIQIYDDPPVDIFGYRINNLHDSQCEEKINSRDKHKSRTK
jgi:hypothetical protein